MSGSSPHRKRRKSMANMLLGIIGFGDDAQSSTPSTRNEDAESDEVGKRIPESNQPVDTTESSPGTGVQREGGETEVGDSPPTATRSPPQPCAPRQTLQEAAQAALRALDGESVKQGAGYTAGRGTRGNAKSKARAGASGRRNQTADDDVEKEDDAKTKGKGKGRAGAKREEVAIGQSYAESWTKKEALEGLLYTGKPVTSMLVADLKSALGDLELSEEGRKQELLLRLARHLLAGLREGVEGAAAIKGFAAPGLVPDTQQEDSSALTARDARHDKRRQSIAATTLLRKGPDTKDNPILVSSSDDEGAAAAAAAAASAAADGTESSAVDDQEHQPKRKRTTKRVPETAPADAETNGESMDKSLAAGPQPGMTLAELRNGVKALGLKPKGARKADLEACWRTAVNGSSKMTRKQEAASSGTGSGAVVDGSDIRVGGIFVSDMKVVMLKKHIADMGLTPDGRLKADLQHCLCQALRRGGYSTGKRPPKVPSTRVPTGKDVDSSVEPKTEDSRRGRRSHKRSSQPPSVSPVAGRRGKKTRSESEDAYEDVDLSPDRVRFHGQLVSDMDPEDRREHLHELEMPSHRMDDDEITHDLLEGLVQRKAEAAEKDPRKQKWRGRRVTIMRKAELCDALEEFETDTSGKAETMRARLRKELWKWASSEVQLASPGHESGDGASTGALASNEHGGEEQPSTATSFAHDRGESGATRRASATAAGTPSLGEKSASGVAAKFKSETMIASLKLEGGIKSRADKSTNSALLQSESAPKRARAGTRVDAAGGSGVAGGGGDDDGDEASDSGTEDEEPSPARDRGSKKKPPRELTPSKSPSKGKGRLDRKDEAAQSASPSPSMTRRRGKQKTAPILATDAVDEPSQRLGTGAASTLSPAGSELIARLASGLATDAAQHVESDSRAKDGEAPPGGSGAAGGQSGSHRKSSTEGASGNDDRGKGEGGGSASGGDAGGGAGGDGGGADGGGNESDNEGGDGESRQQGADVEEEEEEEEAEEEGEETEGVHDDSVAAGVALHTPQSGASGVASVQIAPAMISHDSFPTEGGVDGENETVAVEADGRNDERADAGGPAAASDVADTPADESQQGASHVSPVDQDEAVEDQHAFNDTVQDGEEDAPDGAVDSCGQGPQQEADEVERQPGGLAADAQGSGAGVEGGGPSSAEVDDEVQEEEEPDTEEEEERGDDDDMSAVSDEQENDGEDYAMQGEEPATIEADAEQAGTDIEEPAAESGVANIPPQHDDEPESDHVQEEGSEAAHAQAAHEVDGGDSGASFEQQDGHGVVDYDEGEDEDNVEDEGEGSGGHHMVDADEDFGQGDADLEHDVVHDDGEEEEALEDDQEEVEGDQDEVEDDQEDGEDFPEEVEDGAEGVGDDAEGMEDDAEEVEDGQEEVEDYQQELEHDDLEGEEEEEEEEEDEEEGGVAPAVGEAGVVDLVNSSEEETMAANDASFAPQDREYGDAEQEGVDVPLYSDNDVADNMPTDAVPAEIAAAPSAPTTQDVTDDAVALVANGSLSERHDCEESQESGDMNQEAIRPATVAGDLRDSPGKVGRSRENVEAEAGAMSRPAAGCREDEGMEYLDPRAGIEEIAAMVGEIGYDVKQDVMRFLANPEAGAVNSSLPKLTAEQEAHLRNPPRSSRDWDADLILGANPFLQLAREHLRPRITAAEPSPATYGPTDNNGRRPNVLDVVPSMRRGIRSPEGRRGTRAPSSPPQGLAGSAFGTIGDRRADQESQSMSGDISDWSRQGGVEFGSNGPSRDKRRIAGGDARDYPENEESYRKRYRLDDEGRAGTLRSPGFAAPASTRLSRRRAGAGSSLATPVRTPRHGAGPLVGDFASRRRSSGSVLRRRNPFTPHSRPRPSLIGEQPRPDAGTLGEWLGHGGGAIATKGAASDSKAGDLKNSSQDGTVGIGGDKPTANDGKEAAAAAGVISEGSAMSLPAFDGADTPRLRRVSTEAAATAASMAAAKAKATAEVGSILMDIVGQQKQQQQQQQQQPREKHLEPSLPKVSGSAATEQPTKRTRQATVAKAPDAKPFTASTSAPIAAATVHAPVQALALSQDPADFSFSDPQLLPRQQELAHAGVSDNGDPPRVSSDQFVFKTNPRRADRRRRPEFTFARPAPAKRSLSDGNGHSENDAEVDNTAVFHFSKRPSKRRVVRRHERPVKSGSAQKSATGAPPAIASKASASTDTSSKTATTVDAPFDMSKFTKPGEWKCSACLVRNGPEHTKCLSCETPRPGASTSASGVSGQGATPSMGARSGLLSGVSGSSTPFTFGAQSAGGATGTSSATTNAPGATSASGSAASSTNMPFDMSKFTKPGEWKCQACFVRNGPEHTKCQSCETPKPGGGASGGGGGQGTTSSVGTSGGLLAGVSTASGSFTFGVQAVAGLTGNSSTTSTPTAASATGAASSANAPFDMSKFNKPGEWKCQACFVRNGPGHTKCQSCETPRPGGATSAVGGASSGGRGGVNTAPPTAAPGGLLSGSSATSGGFTFRVRPGATAEASGASPIAPAASGGFRFGAVPSTAPAPTSFQFGATSRDASAAAAPSSAATTAGTGRGGFIFGASSSSAANSTPDPIFAAPSSSFTFGSSSSSPAVVPDTTAASALPSPPLVGGFAFGQGLASGSLTASQGSTVGTANSGAKVPAFNFSAPSASPPSSTSRTSAPTFNFGTGSLPAPANLNAPATPFTFGASPGPIPAPGAGSSGPTFTFGTAGSNGKK